MWKCYILEYIHHTMSNPLSLSEALARCQQIRKKVLVLQLACCVMALGMHIQNGIYWEVACGRLRSVWHLVPVTWPQSHEPCVVRSPMVQFAGNAFNLFIIIGLVVCMLCLTTELSLGFRQGMPCYRNRVQITVHRRENNNLHLFRK